MRQLLVNLCCNGSGVGWMWAVGAGTGKVGGNSEENEGRHYEDAAFGAGAAARKQRPPDGVRGEQVIANHVATIGDTEEEGLGPVPRGVCADGPPE